MERAPTTVSRRRTTEAERDVHLKVARLHGPRDIRLHDEAEPTAGAHEELIRVAAVGLCGSDRHSYLQGGIGDALLTRPLVLGHEISGVIDGGPRRGEPVAIEPAVPCDACELCRGGLGHLCGELRFAGHGTTDGGLRTLMTWPRRQLVPVPAALGAQEAALLEPLAVALHAVDLGKVEPGMSAGVFGCGPIGLLLIQVLRHVGVEPVVATDPLPHRRAAAAAFGAGQAVEPSTELPVVDVAFEAAGEDAAVDDAISAVRPAGRVVLVGIPASDRTSFGASAARRKGLTLLLSRRSRAGDLARAADLAGSGSIDLHSLVTGTYPLDASGQAFEDLVQMRGLKRMVVPQG
jgi:L-iditol 2-dehydrogenase